MIGLKWFHKRYVSRAELQSDLDALSKLINDDILKDQHTLSLADPGGATHYYLKGRVDGYKLSKILVGKFMESFWK